MTNFSLICLIINQTLNPHCLVLWQEAIFKIIFQTLLELKGPQSYLSFSSLMKTFKMCKYLSCIVTNVMLELIWYLQVLILISIWEVSSQYHFLSVSQIFAGFSLISPKVPHLPRPGLSVVPWHLARPWLGSDRKPLSQPVLGFRRVRTSLTLGKLWLGFISVPSIFWYKVTTNYTRGGNFQIILHVEG